MAEKRKSSRYQDPSLRPRNESSLMSGASWSGHERNHLFINGSGKDFSDVTSLVGLDHPGDSRSFAILDFDRDGYQDIAMVNSNAPSLKLYHNRLGRQIEARTFVALGLVGGNHEAAPDSNWSHRDGYGAKIRIRAGDLEIHREHRCGEGFAAQNSDTILVGLGRAERVDELEIRWPSGRRQVFRDLEVGRRHLIHENPEQGIGGAALQSHRLAPAAERPGPRVAEPPRLEIANRAEEAKILVYKTMATWCDSCRRELPQARQLRRAFDDGSLAILGVPCDEPRERRLLEAYVLEHDPAYRLLVDLPDEDVAEVRDLIARQLGIDALPGCVITDRSGRVLSCQPGLPTVSDIRRLLREIERR